MNKYLRIFKYPLYHPGGLVKRYCSASPSPKPESKNIVEVPGLSSKVLQVPSQSVGPGASKTTGYKNPEYFCYDNMSYFEAEIEMLKFRLPQPSSKKE
ncbi:NADH dehydrogenase [ubiquinone] flavoprotein 3, mitochondrial [Halyomorpha halys]|uniref:NADH dehydrogenase [ubiquinone] flavoprotein 3, mitochondrial n=1 Tax=Halyomorpha halys TaxID=286706 RepID=UPI0006D4DDC5|nr:NADH dehydrogenase [ubiquinone] flavoprotein 3, mitochondrial [Halyomorpha halys]